jgi:hypothetical protein
VTSSRTCTSCRARPSARAMALTSGRVSLILRGGCLRLDEFAGRKASARGPRGAHGAVRPTTVDDIDDGATHLGMLNDNALRLLQIMGRRGSWTSDLLFERSALPFPQAPACNPATRARGPRAASRLRNRPRLMEGRRRELPSRLARRRVTAASFERMGLRAAVAARWAPGMAMPRRHDGHTLDWRQCLAAGAAIAATRRIRRRHRRRRDLPVWDVERLGAPARRERQRNESDDIDDGATHLAMLNETLCAGFRSCAAR